MAERKKVIRDETDEPIIPVLGTHMDDYIKAHAPTLLEVYLTLQPFSYLFSSTSAGPQKQARDYDPAEPQYILLGIDDPRYPGGETDGVSLECRITANRITLSCYSMNCADGQNYCEESEITLAGLWDYLRQIPKPYVCFCKGGE